MAVKCKNGHWYDPNVFRSCPHCKKKNETLSLMVDNVEEDDKTVSIMDADLSLGEQDRKSTRLNSSHNRESRMPSSA